MATSAKTPKRATAARAAPKTPASKAPTAPRAAAKAVAAPKKPKAAASPRLNDLQVGGRLRHARLLAGIRMRDLADKVGCTESMVSKIEAGRVVPSLPMLQRLVDALGRDLASFFGSDPNSPAMVLRNGQRPIAHTDPIREGQRVSYERLVPFGAGNLLEGNIHVVEAGGLKIDPITHQGETLGYVVEGQIELTVEATSYTLNAGDSFFFKNHLTNRYRNPGTVTARVLWVNTPQVH